MRKRTNESQFRVRGKEEEIKTTQAALNERKEDLKAKKQELDQITSESQEEEKDIVKKRDKQATTIEPRLLNSYNKIRGNALNGLAVVMVKRGACGGCFNVVPPQRQADIKDKKKIIVCEHCGRIFADVEGVPEPAPTRSRTVVNRLTMNTIFTTAPGRYPVFLFLLLLFSVPVAAQDFAWTPGLQQVYADMQSLRVQPAQQRLVG